jgi:hypothetical protein
MKLNSLPEQLFASAVDMDPLLDGFSGVLVEIYRERESSGGFRYVLLETAFATGNQLFRFSSKNRELVYAALAHELGSSAAVIATGFFPPWERIALWTPVNWKLYTMSF